MEYRTLTEIEKKALVLVRRGQCLSRADLARSLHVSRPTASLVVEKLMDAQALYESGPGKSSRGKAPTLLVPAAGFQYTIGLDLGYSRQLAGVLLDGGNRILRKMETAFENTSLEDIRKQSMLVIEQLSGKYPVSGIGIALPGIMDPGTGRVIRSINPLFISCDLQKLFARWTQLPVVVENRSRAAVLAEAFGGAADQEKNFMLCSLGKSIGAAFWLNGAIFQGSHGAAGEIRCIRLPDGRTLEDALSFENVSSYSEDELVSLCAGGLRQPAELMDLELVVLAGRFTDFGAGFMKKLTRELSISRKCRLTFSSYGRFSASRGIAMSMAEKFPAGPLPVIPEK